jgi:hypothetical protein
VTTDERKFNLNTHGRQTVCTLDPPVEAFRTIRNRCPLEEEEPLHFSPLSPAAVERIYTTPRRRPKQHPPRNFDYTPLQCESVQTRSSTCSVGGRQLLYQIPSHSSRNQTGPSIRPPSARDAFLREAFEPTSRWHLRTLCYQIFLGWLPLLCHLSVV